MNRSKAREQAFILTFEKVFHKEQSIDEMIAVVNAAAELGAPKEGEGSSLIFAGVDPFASLLANGVEEKKDELDLLISRYSTGWKVERIPKISLSILRLASFEILHMPDIPISVSINEAVELAKKYASQEDAAFINGVLGSIAKEEAGEAKV